MNATNDDVLSCPALYYPYIHVRSEHWLKATLLCVPAVKRIVPEDYTPEDIPSIVKYTDIVGVNGPLLQSVPSYSEAADLAQQRLLVKLQAHPKEMQKYARRNAPVPDQYWIHVAKFNSELLEYLRENELAWHSDHSKAYGHRTWLGLHPVLGSAIMTTLGLSIAREYHYNIVTPSTDFHEALLATRDDAIFEALLTDKPMIIPTSAQASHDLGELVIAMTGINFQALAPEDIPELQESEHFRKFQRLIRANAQRIQREDDIEDYRARLQSEGEEIIDAWNETKSDVSKGIKDALYDSALPLTGEALKVLIKGPDFYTLAIAGTVAIALLTRRIPGLIKKAQAGPHQYLTEVIKAQNEMLRITYPLGLEPHLKPA
jgi:hypothetical protein